MRALMMLALAQGWRGDHMDRGWGGWLVMAFMMAAFWAGIIVLGFVLVRASGHHGQAVRRSRLRIRPCRSPASGSLEAKSPTKSMNASSAASPERVSSNC